MTPDSTPAQPVTEREKCDAAGRHYWDDCPNNPAAAQPVTEPQDAWEPRWFDSIRRGVDPRDRHQGPFHLSVVDAKALVAYVDRLRDVSAREPLTEPEDARALERMARALCAADGQHDLNRVFDPEYANDENEERADYFKLARAALAAVSAREPGAVEHARLQHEARCTDPFHCVDDKGPPQTWKGCHHWIALAAAPQAETRGAGNADDAFDQWFDGDFAKREERCDGIAVCMAMIADSLQARDISAVMRQAWHAALAGAERGRFIADVVRAATTLGERQDADCPSDAVTIGLGELRLVLTEALDANGWPAGSAPTAGLATALLAWAETREAEERAAPDAFDDAKRARTLLLRQAARALAARGLDADFAEIARVWDEVVGQDVAAAAKPHSIQEGGVLVVRTASPAWSAQAVFLEREIVAGLAAKIGRAVVTRLRLRVAPAPTSVVTDEATLNVLGRVLAARAEMPHIEPWEWGFIERLAVAPEAAETEPR